MPLENALVLSRSTGDATRAGTLTWVTPVTKRFMSAWSWGRPHIAPPASSGQPSVYRARVQITRHMSQGWAGMPYFPCEFWSHL